VSGTESSFTIRKAHRADSEGILACLAAAFEPFQSQYTPMGYRDTVLTAETVLRRLNEMTVFVAIAANGTVIGTIGSAVESKEEGHLRGMAVLPEWQGSSVATELLRAAEQEIKSQGRSRITLDTTQPLQRAIRFYEKHGFKATGKVADFFGMALFQYEKSLERE
jgi:N-acetylglutamate synthase-like GNAT family acetyltransferase